MKSDLCDKQGNEREKHMPALLRKTTGASAKWTERFNVTILDMEY